MSDFRFLNLAAKLACFHVIIFVEKRKNSIPTTEMELIILGGRIPETGASSAPMEAFSIFETREYKSLLKHDFQQSKDKSKQIETV